MKFIILDFFFKLFLLSRAYSACVNNHEQKNNYQDVRKHILRSTCCAPMVNNWTKGKEDLCGWESPLTFGLQV